MFRVPRCAALLVLAFAAGGCALVGGSPPERYGGGATLTEAAREASKDSTEKRRRLDVGDEVPPGWGGSEVAVTATGESYAASSQSAGGGGGGGSTSWVLGVVGGLGSLGGQELEGFGFGGLDLGWFVAERARVDLCGLVLSPNLSATSLAGQGLKDEFELAVDLSGRYYLTPQHTFFGIYPIAGMRFGTMFWGYRTPVNVIADGVPKTITDDYLNYWGLYGGMGLVLGRGRHFSTEAHLTGGFREYEATTFEGFNNTLFPTTGYSQLAFEMTFRF